MPFAFPSWLWAPRRPLRALLIAAVAVPLALPAGVHAQLPTLGDGSEMSAAAERRLGDRIARSLYRDPDFVDDPVLVEYIQAIWQSLMAAARARGEMSDELQERFAWEVLLGRDRTVNAFALPGGYLGVHAGLIAITASRDELASVLAHELSHVTQRHISRLMTQQSRSTPLMLAAMVMGALAAGRSPEAANALIVGGSAVHAQGQLNFSRAMEREADRVGYGVMTGAGFDGHGFAGMFEKLQQASRINDNGSFPYLRSHPLTTERIADMRSRLPMAGLAPDTAGRSPAADNGGNSRAQATAGVLPPVNVTAATVPGGLAHAMVVARARVVSRPGVDALRAWAGEPDQGGFKAQPPVRQVVALYAGALASVQQRDLDHARTLAARLVPLVAGDARPARLVRLLGAEIELTGNRGAAAAAYLAVPADKAAPAGRPEVVYYAQAGQHGSGARDVSDRLQTWVARNPRDATAWQLLAAAYRADGQPLRALRAEAEAQIAHVDWQGAVDRYRAGQELMRAGGPGADYVEASISDTRLREAELRLREEAAER
ncbi:M48 family metalloprotease [Xylophilus ampelinus]|uniref:Putative Zn-dependent protease n=1 Tax=Xylophilus ampelinus TaxID=54067 RepID=A0A318SW05_9BURK|nr:M48 family metalloprotease [Xylophilus ampelinus]MCS4509579.1 M48 family metalloprotease [Xylophilus ampelinus]PYE78940.1 putative Zn-dependent protease [Xylophilus ampelinus]